MAKFWASTGDRMAGYAPCWSTCKFLWILHDSFEMCCTASNAVASVVVMRVMCCSDWYKHAIIHSWHWQCPQRVIVHHRRSPLSLSTRMSAVCWPCSASKLRSSDEPIRDGPMTDWPGLSLHSQPTPLTRVNCSVCYFLQFVTKTKTVIYFKLWLRVKWNIILK